MSTTPRTLDVNVPHNLGKAEARRRLMAGLNKATGLAAGAAQAVQVDVRETTGDRLDISASAMGQSLTGHVDVFDDKVSIHVTLPWLLAKLAEKLKPMIQQRASDALKLPGPSGPPAKN